MSADKILSDGCSSNQSQQNLSEAERTKKIQNLVRKIKSKHLKVNSDSQASTAADKKSKLHKKQCSVTGIRSSKKTHNAVVGWLHRDDKDSKYKSVNLRHGGGQRKVEYTSAEIVTADLLLEKAKTVFFPNGRSKKGEMTKFNFEMGDFKHDAIKSFQDVEGKEVTLSEYLKSHGLFSSRVPFYMMTTGKEFNLSHPSKKIKLSDESVKPSSSEAVLGNFKNRISIGSSTAGSQLKAENHFLVPSFARADATQACASQWLEDQRLHIRYDVPVESQYAEQAITICSFSRQQCKDILSHNDFDSIEKALDEFQPPEHGFVVTSIEKGRKQYLITVDDTDETRVLDEHQVWYQPNARTFAFPSAGLGTSLMLHEPSEVWGYDNKELVIAVVTSCPRQSGMYTWFRNSQAIKKGFNFCCLAVSEEGDYSVKVELDGKEAVSKVLHIEKCSPGFTVASTSKNSSSVGSKINTSRMEDGQSTQTASYGVPLIEKQDLKYDPKVDEIGRGTFGSVYKASWAGTPVAVKQMKVRNVKVIESVLKSEVHVHSKIRHPNIVQIMAVATGKNAVYIVCELVKDANLDELLFADDDGAAFTIPDEQKTFVGKQIVQAVAYLHNLKPPILHRDIKPANILVAAGSFVTKLCDMGLGKIKSAQTTARVTTTAVAGTPNYMAPECLLRKRKATTKADVWSLACTLLELFTGKDCWGQIEELATNSQDNDEEDSEVPQGCGGIYGLLQREELPNALDHLPVTNFIKEIIVRCFEYNAVKRPDAIAILQCFP